MRGPKRSAIVAAVMASAIALYAKLIQPWHVRWGATDDEVSRQMPLDDRIAEPTIVSTRAVTIGAPSERVWPWIVQMGDRPRAGYYSYAWIERMQGMSIENAERTLPEYQSLAVGDTIDNKNGTIAVPYIDHGHALVLGPRSTSRCCAARGHSHSSPPRGAHDWLRGRGRSSVIGGCCGHRRRTRGRFCCYWTPASS